MIGHVSWGAVWWGLVVAGVVALALLALVIGVVAFLIRSRPGAGPTARTGAMRILEERYAGGEISREEFLERRSVLSGSPDRVPDGTDG
jgi:putative membrane protein